MHNRRNTLNKNHKENLSEIFNKTANIVEAAVAATLFIGILFLLSQMIMEYATIALHGGNFDFSHFLTRALDLIIGIEFTRMLCRHTPDTIIDVLMFATARQAILDHSRILENLFAVIAIALLFAVKKYILSHKVVANE
jgi:hypothetical protein